MISPEERALAIRFWDEVEREVHERGSRYDRDPASMRIDPFPVLDRLFYVGDKVVSVHLLDTREGLVLFDSGFPHAASLLLENIAAIGYSAADIKYILHTHEHYDHFGATRSLQTQYGCRAYLHGKGAETFRFHPHHTEIQSAGCPEASLFIPDVELKDGDHIRLGEADILCAHTPGHSAGAVSFFFELKRGGRKIRIGLCGVNGNLPLHPGRLLKYGIPLETGQEYLGSIEKLMGMDIDLALDTHPRPNGIVERRLAGADTFIDPSAWDKSLAAYRERYAEMMEVYGRRLEKAREGTV